VPKNLTLTVDESLLRAARKLALDQDTSVNQLVRDYLAGLVEKGPSRRRSAPRSKVTAKSPEQPKRLEGILKMRGMGKDLWKNEDPDDYVRKLREGWE
jgi:hypothetical protein